MGYFQDCQGRCSKFIKAKSIDNINWGIKHTYHECVIELVGKYVFAQIVLCDTLPPQLHAGVVTVDYSEVSAREYDAFPQELFLKVFCALRYAYSKKTDKP